MAIRKQLILSEIWAAILISWALKRSIIILTKLYLLFDKKLFSQNDFKTYHVFSLYPKKSNTAIIIKIEKI